MPAFKPSVLTRTQPRQAQRQSQRQARRQAQRRAQGGALLVEALIVILMFSFGLLAIVGLQAKATQVALAAEDANRAALLAGEMSATMWAQRSVTVDDDKLEAWQDKVASPTDGGLPNGVGEVSVEGDLATITITWKHPAAAESEPSAVYTTNVLIN